MDRSASDIRILLRVARTLRQSAAATAMPDYAHKLLRAAAALEDEAMRRAEMQALPIDRTADEALHAPVDLRV